MTTGLLVLLALGLLLTVAVVVGRRAELRRLHDGMAELDLAKTRGSHAARLQYPDVDLMRCIGCGTCVRACPEHGVLDVLHGQAVVVHGARCVGHGLCADACPVGAIALTLGDISTRRDLPVLSGDFEATVPGLFLAGEVTGYALIRTAIAHGTAVADVVAARATVAARSVTRAPAHGGGVATLERSDELDLCIVGGGPAGLACALQAKAHGLRYVVLEREPALGGTVAQYPRGKLVMTQPVALPLHGKLDRTTYLKEELVGLWEEVVAQHALPIRTGEELIGVAAEASGGFRVRTKTSELRARHVCLALGRRGTPRKLGVPGEDLPKVAYSLIDAASHVNRRILVVGGGDSAVEAALGLAEQPGNTVTLSYRKAAFTRIKARNTSRLADAIAAQAVEVLYESQVVEIAGGMVELTVSDPRTGSRKLVLPNDEVFVFAGGVPPFRLLEACGVSFDPALREAPETPASQGIGFLRGLTIAAGLTLAVLAWRVLRSDYYGLAVADRPASAWHPWLAPSSPLGLWLGIVTASLIACNLAYLLRRSRWGDRLRGSLRAWMGAHMLTGVVALVAAVGHAAMAPRDTLGGHAFLALAVVVVTGAIGRYLYSFVPHSIHGRELELEEVHARLAALAGEWDCEGRFGERVHATVQELIANHRGGRSFKSRVVALVSGRRDLRRSLARIEAEGRAEGIPAAQIRRVLNLAVRVHTASLTAARYEEVRAVLGSWRYFHRWLALLMVLLAALHIATAIDYGGLSWARLFHTGGR